MTSLLIRFPNTDVFDLTVSGSKLRIVSKEPFDEGNDNDFISLLYEPGKGYFTSMKRFLNRAGNEGKKTE